MTTTNISRLPVELLDQIIFHLTLADFFACILVSKEWKQVFRRYYRRTVDLTNRSSVTQMLRACCRSAKEEALDPLGHVVRNLKIDDGAACLKDIVILNNLCPNIRALTFRWAYTAAHNERVDSMKLSGAGRRFFSTPFPFLNVMASIKHLSLEPRRQAAVARHIRCSAHDLKYYLVGGENLRQLTLIGVLPQLLAEHLDTIHTSCPNLSELHITTNFTISNSVNIQHQHFTSNNNNNDIISNNKNNNNSADVQQPASSLEKLSIRCSRREASPETFHAWFYYFGSRYPNLRQMCLEYQSIPSRMQQSLDEDVLHGYAMFTEGCTKLESIKLVNLPAQINHLPLIFNKNMAASSLSNYNSNNYNATTIAPLKCVNFISEGYTIGNMDPSSLADLFCRLRNIEKLNLCIPITLTASACLPALSMLRNLTSLKVMRTEKLGSLELDEPLSKVTVMVDDLLARCPNLKQLTLSQFVVRTHRRAYCNLDYTTKEDGGGGGKNRFPLEILRLVDSSLSESCISFFAYKCPAIQHLGLYTCLYYDELGHGISRFKIHMPYHRLKTLQIFNPKTVHGVPLEWNRELLFDLDHIKVATVRSLAADRSTQQGAPDEYFTVDGLNFFTKWFLTTTRYRFNGLNSVRHHEYNVENDDPLLTAEQIFDDNIVGMPASRNAFWRNKFIQLSETRVHDLYKRIKHTSGFPRYHMHHRNNSNGSSTEGSSNRSNSDRSSSPKRRRLVDDPDIIMLDPVVETCYSEAQGNGYMSICCKSIQNLSINNLLLVSNDVYVDQ
ncbi:hypothetical protein BDB00DRAFT_844883 [Zychaea mexicana]|uniref:uncharacterized protein n=1 Tax=Zychaea mexicana TaxID=64656 RepID=UPI0022FEA7A6|nr:uncharacterized protein BDB00DRAFT_844883 [Zychaea mexicana]KAI9489148.1 hypothetical protein BDB00DRAFT_844883 [Zychaea mexicana]